MSLGKETITKEHLDRHCVDWINLGTADCLDRVNRAALLSLPWQKCKTLPEEEDSYLGCTLYIAF